MKKILVFCLSVCSLLILQNCEEPNSSKPLSRAVIVSNTEDWFNHGQSSSSLVLNSRDLNGVAVLWNNVKVHRYSKDRYIVTAPVANKDNKDDSRAFYRLIAFHDRGKIRGMIVGIIPDKEYLEKDKSSSDRTFSGQIKTIAITGKKIRTQKFIDGKEVVFYSSNTSTLRVADGEDDWWDGDEDASTMLDEVTVTGESWEDDEPTTWFDDPWEDYDPSEDDEWEDDSWIYDNGNIGVTPDPINNPPDLTQSQNKLCGGYAFISTGDGMTGEILGLGAVAHNSGTNQVLSPYWGSMCVTYGSSTGITSSATGSQAFNTAWNTTMNESQAWLNSQSYPTTASLSAFIMTRLKFNIQIASGGYATVSSGGCTGEIPSTAAAYCN